MKIRTGFVSNSSSSSFLMYGTYVDSDELREKAESAGLEFRYGGETEQYVIGKSIADIGDEQTGRQFKDEVEKKVKGILGNDKEIEFGTYSESWYDG